jgi:succinoglycan biosynthesis transport protein ExoP
VEEEIDLRAYVDVLVRNWKWIAGLTLIAAITAGIVSFLLPPIYEARALVVVTEPRYLMRFDPRFETVDSVHDASKAYPALATGDDLLRELITTLGGSLTERERTLPAFTEMVEASSGGDPSLIELKVRSQDAEKAAMIANAWAELYVEHLNDLYSQSSAEEHFFEEQLQAAEEGLQAAEAALVAYQAQNLAAVLQTRIQAKQATLSRHLYLNDSIELVIQDALSLKERLRLREGEEAGSLADDLAAMLLELDTLSGKGELPIEVQIAGGQSVSNRTVKQQIAFLDDLVTTLRTKKEAIEEAMEALWPEILALQGQFEEARAEERRLQLGRQLAEEVYQTLSRKAEEARIAAQSEVGDVRLASRAAVPVKPVAPKKKLNVAVAGALGLMVGVFGAFALEYFQSPREESIRPGQTGD